MAASHAELVIFLSGNLLLCDAQGRWQPLAAADAASLAIPVASELSLPGHQGCSIRLLEAAQAFNPGDGLEDRLGQGYVWQGLRSQLGVIPEVQFQLAGQALQWSQWHRDHRFCGRCGAPTQVIEQERVKYCARCDLRFYPRLSPCVITLVTRGQHCLLARHARSRQPVYTCLAGFVEVGERPEDTLRREVFEEVGIHLGDLRYFASQPWPFPGQLMLGFFADYAGGDIRIDGHEILDAAWYTYDQLPVIPPIATLSGQLIARFVEQQAQGSRHQPR